MQAQLVDYQRRVSELEADLQDHREQITELKATKRQIKAELDIRIDESQEALKSRLSKSQGEARH